METEEGARIHVHVHGGLVYYSNSNPPRYNSPRGSTFMCGTTDNVYRCTRTFVM